MVEKQIQVLQGELNQMLVRNADYDKIYEVSIRLDELIAKYYKNNIKNKP